MKRSNHKCKSPKTAISAKTCFVCKTTASREQMLRFVSGQGRTVQFDAKEVLPGRGMWLHADKACLEKAMEKRIFCKAAKGTVVIPEDLMQVVERELQNYPEKQKLFFKRSNL